MMSYLGHHIISASPRSVQSSLDSVWNFLSLSSKWRQTSGIKQVWYGNDSFCCCNTACHNIGLFVHLCSGWWLQLYVNGEFLGGADIIEEMSEKGELKQALQWVLLHRTKLSWGNRRWMSTGISWIHLWCLVWTGLLSMLIGVAMNCIAHHPMMHYDL